MKAPLRPAGRSHVVTSRITFRSSVANLGPRISTFRRELFMLVRVKLPLIAAISLLTVFVDQATKSLAAQHLIRGEEIGRASCRARAERRQIDDDEDNHTLPI